jgi:NAD(P)-dependent dehydrogenase (short-subunit alcohol dehydrogenase family)
MRFTARSAFVTGAAGGMGLQIVGDLAAEGCTVTGFDLKPRPSDFPEGQHYIRGDVTEEAAVAAAIAEAKTRTGRLDLLVNAAGVLWFGRDVSLTEVDLAVWRQVLEINLTSIAITCRHAVPLLRAAGGGAMVHLSSTQALRGDDKPQDAYQAAKAGVIALSKSLAIQFAGDNIRSNVVIPGPTDSPLQERWRADPALKAATAAAIPLGRVGRPEDIAAAVLFLLSDDAAFITGTELIVDGGLLARP